MFLTGWGVGFKNYETKNVCGKKKVSRRGERGELKFFVVMKTNTSNDYHHLQWPATRSNAVDRLPRQVVSISLRRMYTNFIKVSKQINAATLEMLSEPSLQLYSKLTLYM